MPIPNTNSDELIKLLKPCMKILATVEFGPEDSYSFSTTIIGCKRERYVLIDMPIKAREDLVMRKIVNIQIILRGCIFRSIPISHFGIIRSPISV